MKFLLLLVLGLVGCSEPVTKYKVSQRVTSNQEGYCNAYIKRIDVVSSIDKFFGSKEENKYHLEMSCDRNLRGLIIPSLVEESKLVEVPRKVTHEEWEKLRQKGPKFEEGTKIKDKRGCIGLTASPYLSDDGDWEYTLSQINCPNEEIVDAFSAFILESEVEKLLVKN